MNSKFRHLFFDWNWNSIRKNFRFATICYWKFCPCNSTFFLIVVDSFFVFNFDSIIDSIIESLSDTTILPFLHALEIHDSKWPPFASVLLLELFRSTQDAKKHFVRVIYNDKLLYIPQCRGTLCSYDEWKGIVEPLIPNDYEKECEISIEEQKILDGQK